MFHFHLNGKFMFNVLTFLDTNTFNYMQTHTEWVCVYVSSFPRSLISWGIVLEHYLNNDLLTYSCQVCFKWIASCMRHIFDACSGLLCIPWLAVSISLFLWLPYFILSPFVCVCVFFFAQHNHHADIDPMKCSNRIFEGQFADSFSRSPHHNVYMTFSHVTHNFQFSNIYVVFNACISVQLAHCVCTLTRSLCSCTFGIHF